MKKSISILILSLSVFCSFGQRLQIELMTGPSLTSLRGNSFLKEHHSSKIGFLTGLGISLSLNEKSSLNSQISYEQKGSKGNMDAVFRDVNGQVTSVGKFNFKTNYEYLSIPILYGFEFGKSVKLKAQCGPFLGYLLKSTLQSDSINGYPEESKTTTDDNKKIDVGLTFGLNLYLPIRESLYFKIGLINNLGLINTSAIPVIENGTIKTYSFNMLIGINYRLNTAH